jgi:hypothetical protein
MRCGCGVEKRLGCGWVDACEGDVRRVPYEPIRACAPARVDFVDVLHGSVRGAPQPEACLVDSFCEGGGHGHDGTKDILPRVLIGDSQKQVIRADNAASAGTRTTGGEILPTCN